MRLLFAAWLFASACVVDATPVPTPVTLPFASSDRAGQPSLAVDPREGFVLTWQERGESGSTLLFAVIGHDGIERRRGSIARGDDWFVNGADFPGLAVLDNGDWVTYFLQKTSPGTYSYAIRLLRSRDAGASWDAPVTIHRDGTDTEHGFVSLQPAGGDRVRAVWLDGRHMAGAGHAGHDGPEHMTLRSAAVGRDGVPVEEAELDDLTCACCQTSAVRQGGRMIVTYRDRTAGEQRDIQLVTHADGRWSAPRVLHVDGWIIAACPVNGPALAGDAERIAALWPTMASGDMEVKLAIGAAAGEFAAPSVLAAGPAELGRVHLAAWPGGWLATRVASNDARVPTLWLAQLDAAGRPLAQHALAGKVGGYPRIAAHDGIALVAWAEAAEGPGRSRIGLARLQASAAR